MIKMISPKKLYPTESLFSIEEKKIEFYMECFKERIETEWYLLCYRRRSQGICCRQAGG